MSDVKWIKINPQFLDGTSFKFMKRASIDGVADFRDKLESVWFEILGLAGIVNNGGYLVNDEIAYKSFEDIAVMLDRTPKEIELCMNFYIKQQMVEIIDDCYCLTNWYKYQSEDGLKRIREQTRLRVAKCRERKECNATVTLPVTLHSISNSNSYSNVESIKENNCQEETKKETVTKKKKIEEERHKYGEYGRILLTDTQYTNLCKKYSKSYLDEAIKRIDEYVEMNGNKNKYKDFNLVIQKAIKEKWTLLNDINCSPEEQQDYVPEEQVSEDEAKSFFEQL